MYFLMNCFTNLGPWIILLADDQTIQRHERNFPRKLLFVHFLENLSPHTIRFHDVMEKASTSSHFHGCVNVLGAGEVFDDRIIILFGDVFPMTASFSECFQDLTNAVTAI